MKTYIFIGVVGCLLACKSITVNKGKSPVQTIGTVANTGIKDTLIEDTLTYIQSEFVARKQKYVDKELSVLLGDLKIDVKSYLTGIAQNNRYIVPTITLSFYSYDDANYKEDVLKQKVARLWIKFKTPLPADSVSAVIAKTNNIKRVWSEMEWRYYGKQIIKDFGLVDF